jgi:hypothetical protein
VKREESVTMSRTRQDNETIDKWGNVVPLGQNTGSGYQSGPSEGVVSSARRSITNLLYASGNGNGNGFANPASAPRYDSGDGSDWFRSKSGKRYQQKALQSAVSSSPALADGRENGSDTAATTEAPPISNPISIPREIPSASAIKGKAGEKAGKSAGGAAWSAGTWSVRSEHGLDMLLNITITGTLKEFDNNAPRWPTCVDDLKKKLLRNRHLDNLHSTAVSVCKSAGSSEVLIPLFAEVIGYVNTTPHTVGWRTGTALDKISVDGTPHSMMFVAPPDHGNAHIHLPFVSDVRGELDPASVQVRAVIGLNKYEDMVRPGPVVGHVLENSFIHKLLLVNSQTKSHPGFAGSQVNPGYVDWKRAGEYEERGQKWRTNIPMEALNFAREMMSNDSGADGDCSVMLTEFALTAHVLNDDKWSKLKNTKHREDYQNDTEKNRITEKEGQCIGLLVRLHGFW